VHAVKQAIAVYQGKGHTVTDIEFTETEEKPIHTILADNEFEAIRKEMEECGIKGESKGDYTDLTVQPYTEKDQDSFDTVCCFLVKQYTKKWTGLFPKRFNLWRAKTKL